MVKKEKVELNIGELSKTAARLEKEGAEMLENAKSIRKLADSKSVLSAIESTNDAIKREIEKNRKYLAEKEEEVKAIHLTVAGEKERAEAEIKAIKDSVDAEKKNSSNYLKKVRDEATVKVKAVEAEARAKIDGYNQLADDSEKAASEAVKKRDSAERELGKLKEKLLV